MRKLAAAFGAAALLTATTATTASAAGDQERSDCASPDAINVATCTDVNTEAVTGTDVLDVLDVVQLGLFG